MLLCVCSRSERINRNYGLLTGWVGGGGGGGVVRAYQHGNQCLYFIVLCVKYNYGGRSHESLLLLLFFFASIRLHV